jgi:hypothetical protein
MSTPTKRRVPPLGLWQFGGRATLAISGEVAREMDRAGVSGVGKVTESMKAARGVQQVRTMNRAEAY